MGNLIDSYILAPRYTVDENNLNDNFIDRRESEVLEMLDNPVDKEFLSEVFKLGFQITDLFQRTSKMPEQLWQAVESCETKYPQWYFARRYREDSMLQRLRRQFFTTLFIVANDYDPGKSNRFIIVRSNDLITVEPNLTCTVMTEAEFLNSTTEDQSFCQKAISEMKGGCTDNEK